MIRCISRFLIAGENGKLVRQIVRSGSYDCYRNYSRTEKRYEDMVTDYPKAFWFKETDGTYNNLIGRCI